MTDGHDDLFKILWDKTTIKTDFKAEQNYIKSIYEYFVAKISLNKATGTFE
jgi:hypothetical protein